jgi:hypothetical protein
MADEQIQATGYAAIAALQAAYITAIDGGDLQDLESVFEDQGTLVIHGGRAFRGLAAILEFLRASRETRANASELLPLRHHTTPPHLEFVEDGKVESSSYFSVLSVRGLDHWGTYRDQFSRAADRWWMEERRITIEGADPTGWIGSGSGPVRV